jgi:hypothetical protein
MKWAVVNLLLASCLAAFGAENDGAQVAFGTVGKSANYLYQEPTGPAASVVKTFSLAWGPLERRANGSFQWLSLDAAKANGERFQVWLLTSGYPADTLDAARAHTARYIVQQGASAPREYRRRFTGEAVLPELGGWRYLIPRSSNESDGSVLTEGFPKQAQYLGHLYQLQKMEDSTAGAPPPNPTVIELLPDVLVGVSSNTRTKDDARRFDGSDYPLVRLTQADYREMADAGLNCFHVDPEQRPWIDDLNVFYWAIGAGNVPYPESLYDSRYLGPALFLDEPAVGTRDSVLRPKLAKEEAFRKAVTPQIAFDAFREFFGHAAREGAPVALLQGFAAIPGVDLGDMRFPQANLFTWETMVSTAAYQLSELPDVPNAIVFEPPGRLGTLRTLPELDMSYGCQLAVDDPKHFTDIIYGFLRGAARATGKTWGISIYGAVDPTDSGWFLTHAYDLGATRFFFWDNGPNSTVPYHECLALSRTLKMRAQSYPARDLDSLNHAAEVAILLPPGYDLGHVHLGRGDLWGINELNLERRNARGIKYREVMGNFFTEIERCIRLGVSFDLLWDLPRVHPTGYREIVRIREDGRVEVTEDGRAIVLDRPRTPARPSGSPPDLTVALSATSGKAPIEIKARADVVETTAPVFYTHGADRKGVFNNAVVDWELYGPNEEDYRSLMPQGYAPRVIKNGKQFQAAVTFQLSKPGTYRLRAATVDLAGRSALTWTSITVTE